MTSEEQREAFAAQLTEAEDWLYGDGEAVEAAEYRWGVLGGDAGGNCWACWAACLVGICGVQAGVAGAGSAAPACERAVPGSGS